MRFKHFPPPCWPGPLDKLVLKTVQWKVFIIIIIIIIIIVVVVVVVVAVVVVNDDTYYWVTCPPTIQFKLSLLENAIGITKVRQNKPPTNSK